MNSSPTLVGENREESEKQSAEKFQKFVFDLFEKNGVINDLRAYLRGHIVNVLKSTQSGETLSCQKHFTQRLELTFQAINILIAEYLLRLEFSYTLSVFVSEIPLANMVFSFARMLMETHDHSELRFKDADVFSILNYIGLKCDSDHANSVVEMYNDNKKTPLLLCIFKCLPMYKATCQSHTEQPVDNEQESSTDDSTFSKSSIEKSHRKPRTEKCKHYSHCKACRARVARIKEKYKRKERGLTQSLRQSSVNSLNVESFLKNISVMEKGLIDELFQQLKSVYEAEIEMMKQEEDKRVKRSLVAHAVQLQKKKEQLELSFKSREAALAQALQQKKRVLWSVARLLKQQHQQMARAMNDVHAEARDLALKEESLKTQLAEAEELLSKRGEEMRKQISAELTILSNHLQSMKLERDNINKERAQLDNLKLDSHTKPQDQENITSHYDLLKNELIILKKYIETVKLDSKCVIERSTMTELSGFSGLIDKDVVLNNRKEASEDEGPKRLVNDLKKQKNVNFEQMSSAGQSEPHRLVYEYQPRSRSRSRSSSEAGDAPDDADAQLALLQDENRRLKEFARQQKEHIDSLAWQHARLQAQLSSQTPTMLPHTSTYTPQTSNVAPQDANFAPLPASYATISANFPPRSSNLNAQSATFSPQVPNVNFTSQSANFPPQTFHFAARSAFFAPQCSNVSRETGVFAPQSGTFGTSVVQPNGNQRPRTASPTGRRPIGLRLQPSTSVANLNVGWRVGAGEELSVFTSVPARVVLPGDDVPFIGVVGNRHVDNRRYLINQWRSLRRRLSPLPGVSKRSASTSRDKPLRSCIAGPTIVSPQNEEVLSNLQPSCSKNDTSRLERNYLQQKPTAEKCVKAEQKSSKEKLKDESTKTPSTITLEKSPNSVLREAKLRLRKLEIEAEAVEKSYLDFRRKKEAREEREKKEQRENDIEEIKRSSSIKKLNETYTKETQRVPLSTLDIDKLLNEINTKLDLPSFKNKNSTEFKINPIPKVYAGTQDVEKVYSETQNVPEVYEESKKDNYLETPLNEFRRLYHSERRLERMQRQRSPASKSDSNRSPIRDIVREFQNDKEKELEIFKHNLGKIYNMSENSIVNYPSELSVNEAIEIENDMHEIVSDIVENPNEPDNLSYTIENGDKTNDNIIQEYLSESKEIENFDENSKEPDVFTDSNKVDDIKQIKDTTDKDEVFDKNLLRVDVENISEVNSIHDGSSTRGFLLYVESAVDNEASESDAAGTKISTQMTIVVGPKRSPRKINTGEETIARAPDMSTDILEPLYNFSSEQISSVQMQLELSKDELNTTLSELEMKEDPDYPDDFSADVDNYNSPTEFRDRSPISLGKTTDDENFWES